MQAGTPDRPESPLIRAARAEVESADVLPAGPFAPPSDEERPGATIGRFKLLQEIGEGGFGTVWMAEQQEPVKRKVALKIIKLGMDTKQVVARFEAERQALALMDHPNIARVLDGGASESGRPYFVMELVRGVPITEYCDRNHLSTEERVRLFTAVCRAVQHAHQKGVIHRDIKPSNVLVTLHDGVPVPKVIDFGIAKATNQELTRRTLFTEFRQFIGTPEYMSPEQAEMSGLDVDTRSDVYSLGVLLYELLTGSTPFDARRLREAGLGEIQRIIREEEPPRPSTRLSTLGDELAVVAGHRKCEAGTLCRSLRGDLDWIVMRALEKDRTRRYDTADAFAQDLQRHLDDEPVLAGPPGAVYRLRKLVRRHRAGVAAAAVVFGSLVAGLALALYGLVEARRGRTHAALAMHAAREEARTARQINDFYTGMLASADPLQRLYSPCSLGDLPLSGSGVARADSVPEMLRLAGQHVEEAFAGKPLLEASVRETIGITLGGFSRYDEGLPHLEQALALREDELGSEHPDTLRSKLILAASLRSERGIGLASSALDGMRRSFGPEHPETLTAAKGLARLYCYADRVEEARALFHDTIERQRRTLGPDSPDTLFSLHLLAWMEMWEGSPECVEIAREVREATRRTLAPEQPFAMAARVHLGLCLLETGRSEEAAPLLQEAVGPCRRMLGDDHWMTGATLLGAARTMRGAERAGGREELLRAALASRSSSEYRSRARGELAATWIAAGRGEEAVALLRDAAEAEGRLHGARHVQTLHADHQLGCALAILGEDREAREVFGRVASALPADERLELPPERLDRMARFGLASSSPKIHTRALRWAEDALASASNPTRYLATVGLAEYRAGRLDDALATLNRADERPGGDPTARAALVLVHAARGEADEARRHLSRMRELLEDPLHAGDLECLMYASAAEVTVAAEPR